MSKLQAAAKEARAVLIAISRGETINMREIDGVVNLLENAIVEPVPCACISPEQCNFLDRCLKPRHIS
jgi:hypothetical protein